MINAAPFVEWPRHADWNAYWAGLSRKLRSDQRRQWRRLGATGKVEFRVAEGAHEAEAWLRWILSTKREWLTRRRSPSRVASPDYADFLGAIARDALASQSLFLAVLELDARPIAGLVGFQDPEHLWAWKFTYDPSVASYSPGRLLWTEVLRWSHARGKRVMDFMPSRYDWKYAFTSRDVEVTSGFVPLSWRGHLFARAWNTPLREQLWRWRRGFSSRATPAGSRAPTPNSGKKCQA